MMQSSRRSRVPGLRPLLVVVAAVLVAALGGTALGGAELTPRQIVERADEDRRPRYEVAKLRMELVSDNGSIMERQLMWRSMNNGEGNVMILKFLTPANVQASGIMISEDRAKALAIWQYFPATRNVRRISAEHKQNRFMGTEFINEDFEGFKLEKYQFSLVKKSACGGERQCYVVEARPTDREEASVSSYLKKRYWIDTAAFFLVKTELYDKGGELVKVLEGEDFRRFGSHWRPQRQTMKHLKAHRETRLVELKRSVNEKFDPYYASHQYLRSE